MVQNHLLQLVCLVAMEPPTYFAADQVRDEKLRVLRALRPLSLDELALGQYASYREELGEVSKSDTRAVAPIQIRRDGQMMESA